MLLFVADFYREQEKIWSSLFIFAPQNPPQSSLCAHLWQMGATEPGDCIPHPEQGENATYCWAFGTRGAFHQHSLSKRKGKKVIRDILKVILPTGKSPLLDLFLNISALAAALRYPRAGGFPLPLDGFSQRCRRSWKSQITRI